MGDLKKDVWKIVIGILLLMGAITSYYLVQNFAVFAADPWTEEGLNALQAVVWLTAFFLCFYMYRTANNNE